ncbi:MAG: dihydrofolate reductase family protein, partial [Terriglobia bacterium]
MSPIQTLFDSEGNYAADFLPPGLRAQYGGDLRFPPHAAERPYVIANFVSTLDGVVSFDIPGESAGAQISGSNEADRFIMGLLRASVDAILVGAGTVNAVPRRALWLPGSIYPAAE